MSNNFSANSPIQVVLKNIKLSEAAIFRFKLYGESRVNTLHRFRKWIAFRLFESTQEFLMDVILLKNSEGSILKMKTRLRVKTTLTILDPLKKHLDFLDILVFRQLVYLY